MLKEAVINKFKVINATANQLLEISFIRLEKTKLSIYDVLNYINRKTIIIVFLLQVITSLKFILGKMVLKL